MCVYFFVVVVYENIESYSFMTNVWDSNFKGLTWLCPFISVASHSWYVAILG